MADERRVTQVVAMVDFEVLAAPDGNRKRRMMLGVG